jgi:hypothetical protein
MVSFNKFPLNLHREEPLTLDLSLGQKATTEQLSPRSLVFLKAFVALGYSETTISVGRHDFYISGPLDSYGYLWSPGEPVLAVRVFDASLDPSQQKHCLCEIYIRENSGAFGINGRYFSPDMIDDLTLGVSLCLIRFALERTTQFRNERIGPASSLCESKQLLATHGVDVELVTRIINRKPAKEPRDELNLRQALMRVLVDDTLTAALIEGLEGSDEIITELNQNTVLHPLLISIHEAYVVAQESIIHDRPVPLDTLLQNKTALVLLRPFIQLLAPMNPLSSWHSVLPKS